MMKLACPGRKERLITDEDPPAGDRRENDWDETELLYGRYLLRDRNPVLRQYLEREIHIKQQILEGIADQDSPRIAARKQELEKEIRKAEKGLVYYAV